MTLTELAQVGIGAAGTGGGAWALVRAFVALKPYLSSGNGNGKTADILRHLEKQGDALNSIAHDIHDSTERLHELVLENRDYQKEGREAMLRISAMYAKVLGT